MRPFALFPTFFSFFSAAALVAANRNETISSNDPRIIYSNGWKPIRFSGRDFAFIRRTFGTAALEVNNASRIAVSVFVEDDGQMVRISLDNKDHDIFPSLSQQPAFTSDILDPNTPHTIEVIKKNPGGKWTSLDSFIVTYPDSADTTDSVSTPPNQSTFTSNEANTSITDSPDSPSSSPQSAPAPSNQLPNTEPVLSGGKLAAVIVVCITVPALIIAGLVYRQRRIRNRKAESTRVWEWMASRAQVPPSQPPPPTPPDERFDGAETREIA